MKTKSEKRILVLASGGYDSLYLMKKNVELGHCVIPLYIDCTINDDQKKCERKALGLQVNQLRKIGLIDNYQTMEFEWQALRRGLSMPPMFTCAGFLYSQQKEKIDEVQLGYVLGDQATSYIKDIRRLWSSLHAFVEFDEYSHCSNSFKRPKLVFPLLKVTKEETTQLDDGYYAWACEQPVALMKGEGPSDWPFDFRPCGRCPSCRRMRDVSSLVFPQWILDEWKTGDAENWSSLMKKAVPRGEVKTIDAMREFEAQELPPLERGTIDDPFHESLTFHEGD